jgi:hypothetical protein
MRIVRLIAVNLAVLAVILIAIEGLAGYLSFANALAHAPDLAERRHTRYDAELGWSNVPNTSIANMYGPGVRLHINGQGFRSDRDFTRDVPAGKLRIICSGDSFTLGYGVDNDHTWCELLSKIDPRLETVNMGQGGYGIDQAYLWYKRDGASLQHQIDLFAFVGDDLPRASAAAFSGYAKPRLAIENGELKVTRVPVPGPANPWLRRLLDGAEHLRTVAGLRALQHRLKWGAAETPDLTIGETQRVLAAMLADLHRVSEQRSSRLLLVFLPTEADLREPDTDWVPPFAQEARAHDIPFIDLTPDFLAVPEAERARLFIRKGELDYPGSEGHYSVAGNELVAAALHERLEPFLTR